MNNPRWHESGRLVNDDEARLLLHDHLGEDGYVALWVENDDDADGTMAVLEVDGELSIGLGPGDLPGIPLEIIDLSGPIYMVGRVLFSLPKLPGTIWERDHGLDFKLAPRLTLRVAWDPAG